MNAWDENADETSKAPREVPEAEERVMGRRYRLVIEGDLIQVQCDICDEALGSVTFLNQAVTLWVEHRDAQKNPR